MKRQTPLGRLTFGSFAGLVATGPMTGVMELYRRCVPDQGRDPFVPRQVAEGMVRRVGFEPHVDALGEPAWWGVTAASHFGFGAAAGALYGLIEPGFRRHDPGACQKLDGHRESRHVARQVLQGSIFGLLVWATHYLALFPLVGLVKPQGDKPIRKNIGLILSHLVWGITTGLIFDFYNRRRSATSSG